MIGSKILLRSFIYRYVVLQILNCSYEDIFITNDVNILCLTKDNFANCVAVERLKMAVNNNAQLKWQCNKI